MRRSILAMAVGVAVAVAIPSASGGQSLLKTLKSAVGTVTSEDKPSSASSLPAAVGYDDIVAGLREALRVGTERVVSRVGAADGYNSDPQIHIPLPPDLQKIQSIVRKFGLSDLADEVELKLNRAAERAAPQTKDLIWQAITAMTLDDAERIYKGPEDAATQYFTRVSSAELSDVIRPVIDQALDEVGAITAFDRFLGAYSSLPLVPDIKGSLSDHAVAMALKGLFHYLAREEAGIRNNPAKRTTELLGRVFGG